MAYDAARQRVVLFGGQTFPNRLADTWEWDGTNWVQRNPAVSPTARDHHALAYDSGAQRIVLFGGIDGPFALADTWEWDGVTWFARAPATFPPERQDHAMAYDAARQRIVLFGGNNGMVGNTWVYGSLVPAGAQRIGSACAGTHGPLVLTSNTPFLGNPAFVLDLLSVRAAAPCVFLLASGTQALALGGGCTLYLDGLYVPLSTAANASGFASVKIAVPNDPSLFGGVAYAQAVVQDPMGGFAGLALSAGRKLTLGD